MPNFNSEPKTINFNCQASQQYWRYFTEKMGTYAEPYFLSAYASAGFEELGRGALCIDFCLALGQLLTYIGYMRWDATIKDHLHDSLMSALDRYDPDSEMIVVVMQRVVQGFGMTTFILKQSSSGSFGAEVLVSHLRQHGLKELQPDIYYYPLTDPVK